MPTRDHLWCRPMLSPSSTIFLPRAVEWMRSWWPWPSWGEARGTCRASNPPRCWPLELINRYRDQDIGLADASLVILAARYRTDRLLTLDHRHFRVIRTLNGRAFSIQP